MSRTSWLCLVTTLVWLPACPKGAPAVEDATPHVTASPTDASALEPPAQTTTASDAGARGRPTWVPKLGDEAAFLARLDRGGGICPRGQIPPLARPAPGPRRRDLSPGTGAAVRPPAAPCGPPSRRSGGHDLSDMPASPRVPAGAHPAISRLVSWRDVASPSQLVAEAPFMTGPYAVDARLADRLLAAALASGGDHAELFFEYRRSLHPPLEAGPVRSVGAGVDAGVGIRVVADGAVGFAYAESFEPAANAFERVGFTAKGQRGGVRREFD